MELTCWIIDRFLSATIIVSGDTFAEVVGLNQTFALIEIVSRPFPIKLILVVTHKHTACHQTSSWCSLYLNIDATKQQIILGPDVWCIVTLIEGELGSFAAVEGNIGIVCQDPSAW